MSSKPNGERRWTLYGRPMPGIDGPEPPKDGVEVMPVSEHERLRKVAQCLVDVWRHTDSETEVHDEIHRLADVLRHPEECR